MYIQIDVYLSISITKVIRKQPLIIKNNHLFNIYFFFLLKISDTVSIISNQSTVVICKAPVKDGYEVKLSNTNVIDISTDNSKPGWHKLIFIVVIQLSLEMNIYF